MAFDPNQQFLSVVPGGNGILYAVQADGGNALYPASYMDFFPYRVMASHPFLNGTGLGVGGAFGAAAYNGAASGWEVDSYAGTAPGTVVIASGLNPTGGADMCQVPKPNGGWVFTTGSIAFNGAIPSDAAIKKILANVFTAAVA